MDNYAPLLCNVILPCFMIVSYVIWYQMRRIERLSSRVNELDRELRSVALKVGRGGSGEKRKNDGEYVSLDDLYFQELEDDGFWEGRADG